MKRNLFFFVIMLFSIITYGQAEDPNDTIINEQEFLTEVLNDIEEHIDTCSIPVLNEISVVRFEAYANIYVPTLPSLMGETIQIYADGNEVPLYEIVFENDQPLFMG